MLIDLTDLLAKCIVAVALGLPQHCGQTAHNNELVRDEQQAGLLAHKIKETANAKLFNVL